jgi:hypothetical protein
MRKKRIRKRSSILKLIFLIVIFASIVSFGYSYLSTVLKIKGNITGQMDELSYTLSYGSDPSLNLKMYQMSKKIQNNTYSYHYSLNIKNIGTATINGIMVTLETNSVIASISISGYDYKITGKSFTITGTGKTLQIGEVTTIDLIINTNISNLQILSAKLEKLGGTDTNNFNVAFNIINSTNSYVYTYSVILTNNTGVRTTSWQIDITLPSGTTYITGSSAIFTITSNVLTIKNSKKNGKINNGANVTIYLQLATNIVNYIPNNVNVLIG